MELVIDINCLQQDVLHCGSRDGVDAGRTGEGTL
jgi:hypothetical protein